MIKLRIAAHLGEIVEDEADLYGNGINITARLQTEAPPGGVMISEDLHRQLDTSLAEAFTQSGQFQLKNITREIVAFQWRPDMHHAGEGEDIPVIEVKDLAVNTDDPEFQDAATDLHDQLVDSLSRRTGVRVVSEVRQEDTAPTYSLRGRLRSSKATAKVNLSLVLNRTGKVLWSNVYQAPTEELFDLVDSAANRADVSLRSVINARDGERLEKLPENVLSASELRARAAHGFYGHSEQGYQHSISLLDRSLRLSPDNSMSLAMWAFAQTWLNRIRFQDVGSELVGKISSRADAAVALNPQSDFAGKVRCEVKLHLFGDIKTAKQAAARVAKINPNYGLLKLSKAEIALAEGAWDQVRTETSSFIEFHSPDPDEPYVCYLRAVAEFFDDDYQAAASWIKQAIELKPTSRIFHLFLSEIYRAAGDETARQETVSLAKNMSVSPEVLAPRLTLPDEHQWLMKVVAPSMKR
jgi:TolB-like protein